MTTCRNGKIAHLPQSLRHELCHRMDNGVPGNKLIAWLNAHPEAQRILAQYYPGRRITQQNLSEWRQGGYQDWVKLQETRHLTLQLAKDPEISETEFNPRKIINAMATITAAEFAHTGRSRLRECIGTKERWKHVCEMNDHLSRLRRADLRNMELSLRQEKRDYELAAEQRAAKQAAEVEARRQVLASLIGRADLLPPIIGVRPNIQTAAQPAQNGSSAVPHPIIQKSTNPSPIHSRITHHASDLFATKNPVENAHLVRHLVRHSLDDGGSFSDGGFPSGTNPNQARKNFTSSNHPPIQKSINPSLVPLLSLTLDHPASMYLPKPASTLFSPAKNQVKTPQFPSGTGPNRVRKNIGTDRPASTMPDVRAGNSLRPQPAAELILAPFK